MNYLTDDIKKTFFKYLVFAFGSSFLSSIYSMVDMAVVGQYVGPNGTGALAIVAPVWNVVYGLGLLFGVGGSILYNVQTARNKQDKANQYFTETLLISLISICIVWLIFLLFQDQIFTFFGASEELLPLAKEYIKPIFWILPCFTFNSVVAAFLRNDYDPKLATLSVITGGLFNVFGDIYFVFGLHLGMFGAGLATAIGSVLSLCLMMRHFFKKDNHLKLVKFDGIKYMTQKIISTGFSSFIVDVSMGVLTVLFNNTIMTYLNSDALAIYSTIINISTFVQCCAYSVGQAAQPILSANYSSQKYDRVLETLKYSIIMCIIFGIFWLTLSQVNPNIYIYIFMKPTESILEISSYIIRCYSLSFILLPFNVFATYYFQSILRAKLTIVLSLLRSVIISSIFIIVLPLLFGGNSVWFAMPICELIIMILTILLMKKYNREFKTNEI